MAGLAAFRKISALYRSLQGTPTRKKLTLVANRLRQSLRPRLARLRRRVRTGQIGLVFRLLGPDAGVKAFWGCRYCRKSWEDVEARLSWLKRQHPDHIAMFVGLAVEKTTDASTLLGLSRSAITDNHLRPLIALNGTEPAEVLRNRFERSQVFAAAYVGALMLLEGSDTARLAQECAYRAHRLPRKNYERFLDSISFCPARDAQSRSLHSGFHRPTRHRLLILEGAQDLRSYRHLMRDSRKVTVIDLADLYGKTTFDGVSERGVEEIRMEHVRTRITRFSPEYHQLHEDTKQAAQHIMRQLSQIEDAGRKLFGSAAAHIELELADQIFFSAMKLRALQKLLQDPDIDHVVIAHKHGPNRPFDRLLSCLDELPNDPRVEFVSIAQGLAAHFRARDTIMDATHPHRLSDRALPPVGLDQIKTDLERKIANRISQLNLPKEDGRKRVLVLTSHNTAYDTSTIASIAALSETCQVDAIFSGSSLQQFLKEENSASVLEDVDCLSVSHNLIASTQDLRYWLYTRTQSAVLHLEPRDIRAIILAQTDLIIANSLLPGTADFAFMKARMAQLEAAGLLPSLCLVTPQRNPRLGVLSEAVRDSGTPSLAIEPHGLNGNYCRYSKVAMDYYGVISQYFLETAESDFGISTSRSRIIGSPRIRPPANYHPELARTEARAELAEKQQIAFEEDRTYISFFCQPSQWEHVAKVWSNVLKATRGLDVTLLLKTHPEESKSRIARYMEIAREQNAGERILQVDGDPNRIIAASDLVLTGYSAAAIDAAVMQRPILCVTADDEPYPIDQHTIVHSTLCGDVATLESELRELLTSAEERARRASAFLRAEPQFIAGSDTLLREFVEYILAKPAHEALRSDVEKPHSLFLDGPFKPFHV